MGETWTWVDDDAHQYGHLANAGAILADVNDYGKVYRSTAGIGIPFFDAYPDIAATDTVNYLTSVKQNSSVPSLWVYPNPSGSVFTVQSNSKIQMLTIYNTNGQMVEQINCINNVQQPISFGSQLNSGLYMLQVTTNNGVKCQRLIKN